jgi:hypothetical protein
MTAQDDMDPQPPKQRVPMPVVLAVVLLEIIALGSLGFAALLLLVTGSLGLEATGVMTLTALACVVLAVAALPAGLGLWRGRAWGWGIALGIAAVGLLAVLTAALSGAFQPELLVAIILFGGLAACLFTRTARVRSGIG